MKNKSEKIKEGREDNYTKSFRSASIYQFLLNRKANPRCGDCKFSVNNKVHNK